MTLCFFALSLCDPTVMQMSIRSKRGKMSLRESSWSILSQNLGWSTPGHLQEPSMVTFSSCGRLGLKSNARAHHQMSFRPRGPMVSDLSGHLVTTSSAKTLVKW